MRKVLQIKKEIVIINLLYQCSKGMEKFYLKQTKENRKFYENFLKFSLFSLIAIFVILALLAIFLV